MIAALKGGGVSAGVPRRSRCPSDVTSADSEWRLPPPSSPFDAVSRPRTFQLFTFPPGFVRVCPSLPLL